MWRKRIKIHKPQFTHELGKMVIMHTAQAPSSAYSIFNLQPHAFIFKFYHLLMKLDVSVNLNPVNVLLLWPVTCIHFILDTILCICGRKKYTMHNKEKYLTGLACVCLCQGDTFYIKSIDKLKLWHSIHACTWVKWNNKSLALCVFIGVCLLA